MHPAFMHDTIVVALEQDCWNRPISSAPGAWIDVLERDATPYNRSAAHTVLLEDRMGPAGLLCMGCCTYVTGEDLPDPSS